MTNIERIAYLKGLIEGMKIDESTNEGKLFINIIDVLEDMAMDMADLCDDIAEISDAVDEIDEALSELEEDVYGDEDDACDCDAMYEVECPSCGDTICLDEGMIEEGEIECPNCGEKLEFDLDEEDEDACGCGCEDEEK